MKLPNLATKQTELIGLLLIFVVSIGFKLYFISGNTILFWFDQARDATIARTIVEEGAKKIQGPSVSGTNDQLYHGVLYYYVIGPLYTLFDGDPFAASIIISIISSLSIIPTYLLSLGLTKSKFAAYFSATIFAISSDAAITGSWLSNPVIAELSIPIFFWLLWEVFGNKKYSLLPWLTLALGISHQSVLSSLYLFLPLILAYAYRAISDKRWFYIRPKILIISALVYIVSISTMILNQAKLYYHGLFNPFLLINDLSSKQSLIDKLTGMVGLYATKLELLIFAEMTFISIVAIGLGLTYYIVKISKDKLFFYLLWWLSLGLFSMIIYRDPLHALVGVGAAFGLPLAYAISHLPGKLRNISVIFITIPIVWLNFNNLSELKLTRVHPLAIQKDALLFEQLSLIDTTYELANGEPFSISTLGSPYGWNTTWSYLYDWYGLGKFKYKPSFYGPDQSGIFAGDKLSRSANPNQTHFVIIEPSSNVSEVIYEQFINEQNRITSVIDTSNFGSLILETRESNITEKNE